MPVTKGVQGSLYVGGEWVDGKLVGGKKIGDIKSWSMQFNVLKTTHKERLWHLLPFRVRVVLIMHIKPLFKKVRRAIVRREMHRVYLTGSFSGVTDEYPKRLEWEEVQDGM